MVLYKETFYGSISISYFEKYKELKKKRVNIIFENVPCRTAGASCLLISISPLSVCRANIANFYVTKCVANELLAPLSL